MNDIKLILEKPDYVKQALAKKLWDFDPEPIKELSAKRLALLQEVESNKAKQNELSASVPALKKEGKDPSKVVVTGNTVVDAMRYTVRDNYTHPDEKIVMPVKGTAFFYGSADQYRFLLD